PLVIKFGGTSVGGGAQFIHAAAVAADAARERPLAVVVSAMSGTTDTLLGFARSTVFRKRPAADEGTVAELRGSLADRHLKAAREAVAEEHLPAVEERLFALLDQLVAAIEAPAADPASRKAKIAVFGERLSSVILAGAISSRGIPAAVVAEDPIATGSSFSASEVNPERTRERCARFVAPLLSDGTVAVVPGYVGHSPGGLPTTLGRGGSDLSATVLGRALDSEEVWIMSDVDGVLDADPRLVPDAALLPRLSYREAGDFASLGAKVLHPKTMGPASETDIEVHVRNTFAPDRPGTRVADFEEGPGVRCVALRRNFAVELPCVSRRHRKEAAAVIGIGRPDENDLARGRQSLRKAGIEAVHSGIAPAGLVFVVFEEVADKALRALHGSVITAATPAGEVA
ncbi:MAG: aspartate kinase, partial [Rubrobacter sp.]|nr:aspartate kinase [Rubrobacter sp.]